MVIPPELPAPVNIERSNSACALTANGAALALQGTTILAAMSAEVAHFLSKLSDDPVFRARLESAANAEKPTDAVTAILAENGFSFTPEQYLAGTKSLRQAAKSGELSDAV